MSSSPSGHIILLVAFIVFATHLPSMTTLVSCQSPSPSSSSTPYQITPVEKLTTKDYGYGLAFDLERNYLFIATGDLDAGGELAVYNTQQFKTTHVTSIPTNYSILAEYCPDTKVLFLGQGKYFETASGGLQILNVSDITNITTLAYIPYEQSVLGLSMHRASKRLFVSLGIDDIIGNAISHPNGTLLVYDISKTTSSSSFVLPRLIQSQLIVGYIGYSIEFYKSETIYLGTGIFPYSDGALFVLDFGTLEIVNKIKFPRLVFSLELDPHRNLLHAATGAIGNGGMFLSFNVTNTTHPVVSFNYTSANAMIKMCLGFNATFAFIASDKELFGLNLLTGQHVPVGGIPFAFGLLFQNNFLYVAAGPSTNVYLVFPIQQNEISYWAVNKTVALSKGTYNFFVFSQGRLFFFVEGNQTIGVCTASYGTSSGPVFERIGEINTNATVVTLYYDEVTQNLYVGAIGWFLRFHLQFNDTTGKMTYQVTYTYMTILGNVQRIVPYKNDMLILGIGTNLILKISGTVIFIDKNSMEQRGVATNTTYISDMRINDDATLLFVSQSDNYIHYRLSVYSIMNSDNNNNNNNVSLRFEAALSQTTIQGMAITRKGDLFIAVAREFKGDSALLQICNTSVYDKKTKLYLAVGSVFVPQPISDILLDESENALFALAGDSFLIYSVRNLTNPVLKATQSLPALASCSKILRLEKQASSSEQFGLSFVFILCGTDEKMIVIETGVHYLISSVASTLTGTVADTSTAFVGDEATMQFYIFSNQGALLSDLDIPLSNISLIDSLGLTVPMGGSVNFVLKQMKLIITPDVRFTNTFLTFQMRIQNDVVCAFIGVRPSLTVDISPKNIQRPFNIRSLRQQLSVFVKVPITSTASSSSSSENGDGEETTPSSDIGQFIPTNFGTAFSAIINTTLETTGQLNSMNDLLNKVRFLPGTKYSKNALFQMTINDQLNYPQNLQVPAGLFKLLQPPHQAVHFDKPIQRKVYDYLDIVVPTGLFEDSYGLPLQYSIVHTGKIGENFFFETNSMSISGTVPLVYLGENFSIIINATNGYLWNSAPINISVQDEPRPVDVPKSIILNCHPEESTSFYINPSSFNISAEQVSHFRLVPFGTTTEDGDDSENDRFHDSLPSWLNFDTVKGRVITNPGSSALNLYMFHKEYLYNITVIDIYNRTANGQLNILIAHSLLQVILIVVTTFSTLATMIGFVTQRHEAKALISSASLILTSDTELKALIKNKKLHYFKCYAFDRKNEWKWLKKLNYYLFMFVHYRELQGSTRLFDKTTGKLVTEKCEKLLSLEVTEDIAVVMKDSKQVYTGIVVFQKKKLIGDGSVVEYVISSQEKNEAALRCCKCCCKCCQTTASDTSDNSDDNNRSIDASLLGHQERQSNDVQQQHIVDVASAEPTRASNTSTNSVMIHRDPHSSRRHLQQDENDDEPAEKGNVSRQKKSTSNLSTTLSPRPHS